MYIVTKYSRSCTTEETQDLGATVSTKCRWIPSSFVPLFEKGFQL